MPIALIAGPAVALIGIFAVFFVLRRKSVDKRSMYSARRSQIEHKVRAARQRTLAGQKSEATSVAPGPPPGFASPQATAATYEPAAYEPPPVAPPPAPREVQEAPTGSPWDVGTAVTPPAPFEATPAPPAFEPAPAGEVWTPAPAPESAPPEPMSPHEPLSPAVPVRPAMAPAAPAAWSVVGEAKEPAAISAEPEHKKKKGKHDEQAPAGSWTLASGNAPGEEPEDVIRPQGQRVAIAQYAVLVVGLVAVLIGVLLMVGSPVK
jgi:hypothetical protein